jgi:hypothetical protein
MTDVTVASIDEMEAIGGGLARRARATLGVSAWGMQVMTLPANWDGYPDHDHTGGNGEQAQEEVYVPLQGSATLVAGDDRFELIPGTMARVGAEQSRRILPGPDGVQLLALGGSPGEAYQPEPWSELGAATPGGE